MCIGEEQWLYLTTPSQNTSQEEEHVKGEHVNAAVRGLQSMPSRCADTRSLSAFMREVRHLEDPSSAVVSSHLTRKKNADSSRMLIVGQIWTTMKGCDLTYILPQPSMTSLRCGHSLQGQRMIVTA